MYTVTFTLIHKSSGLESTLIEEMLISSLDGTNENFNFAHSIEHYIESKKQEMPDYEVQVQVETAPEEQYWV